jgi:hypothetical protein
VMELNDHIRKWPALGYAADIYDTLMSYEQISDSIESADFPSFAATMTSKKS